jgi:DNA-binding CsgD family transcriptional regulator
LAAAIPDPVIAASITGTALANLGIAAHVNGDLAAARARHEQALRLRREHGYTLGVIRSLRDLGDVARDQGAYADSIAFYRECLSLLGDSGDLRVVGDVLAGAALAAVAWEQPVRAARLLGAAASVRERFGAAIVVPTDRAAQARVLDNLRATLGEQGLQIAWVAGQELALASALAEVQAMAPPETTAGQADHATISLSPREEEVLRRLILGHTDPEIAAALFLSVRTVESHVARILAKLGVRTRTAAATAAIAAGLVASTSSPPG